MLIRLLLLLFSLFTTGCVFISEPDVGAGTHYTGGPWLGEDQDDHNVPHADTSNFCHDNDFCAQENQPEAGQTATLDPRNGAGGEAGEGGEAGDAGESEDSENALTRSQGCRQ